MIGQQTKSIRFGYRVEVFRIQPDEVFVITRRIKQVFPVVPPVPDVIKFSGFNFDTKVTSSHIVLLKDYCLYRLHQFGETCIKPILVHKEIIIRLVPKYILEPIGMVENRIAGIGLKRGHVVKN